MSKKYISPGLESRTVEELTTQLIDVHSKLKTLQKEREMMLANISHDLRAPITAIRSAVDLALSDEHLSEQDFKKTLALIDRRTATLEDLINDMYYLFCVEDTTRPLNAIQIDACTFLEEYFYDAVIDSRYDDFDMQFDVPEDLKCTISVDPQKMARVLDNLMTNAAKYASGKGNAPAPYTPSAKGSANTANKNRSKAGSLLYIRLSARISDSPKGSALEITVSDNGCGIAADALPNIFTRTYTVSDARTPGKSSGSGLGLAIAKAIVERHGGNISVKSKVGEGTEFLVSLPCSIEKAD